MAEKKDEEKTDKDLRRTAYRAALARLGKVLPDPYNEFRLGVAKANPGYSRWQTASAAQRLLRDAFPHRFKEVYDEEKKRLGLKPAVHHGRDWDRTAAKIVRLYDNGNGLSLSKIRKRLKVGSDIVSQAIKDAGITPKRGRRAKDDRTKPPRKRQGQEGDHDGEGAP